MSVHSSGWNQADAGFQRSQAQDRPAELKFLADVFKLESAIAYTVVLDKESKVKAIEGIEKLNEGAAKLDSAIAREEFENEIGTDRLKMKFEQSIHNFPDGPTRTGEPWERTELLEINGKTFTVRKKYEYRGTEKKERQDPREDQFQGARGQVRPGTKGNLPVKVVKSDLKVESSEGTILFDREEGVLAT